MLLIIAIYNINPIGLGAFSLMEVEDRQSTVTVSGTDSDAVIGIDNSDSVEIDQPKGQLVKITNKLDKEVSVRVVPDDSDADWSIYPGDNERNLKTGESEVYNINTRGVNPSNDKDSYTIVVENQDVVIENQRTVKFIDPFNEKSGSDVVDRIENRGIDSDTCKSERHVCENRPAYNLNNDEVSGFVYIENDKNVNNVNLKKADIGGALVVNAGEEVSGISMDGGYVGGDMVVRAHGQNADIDIDLSSGGTIEGDVIVVGEGDISLSFDSQNTYIGGDLRATVPPGRDFDSSVVDSVKGETFKDASTDLSTPG